MRPILKEDGSDETLTALWDRVTAAIEIYQSRPMTEAENDELVAMVIRWNDEPE